jgi:hypothetical protein
LVPGTRPVVLLTWHKDRAFYFNYQKNFLLFSIFGQKNGSFGTPQSYFWRIFILSHFICRGGLYPFKQNNRNTGLKTGKNKNGVATLGYNPRFPVL